MSQFREQLEAFAAKHKKAIQKSPEFRNSFQQMCTHIGVDPLACQYSHPLLFQPEMPNSLTLLRYSQQRLLVRYAWHWRLLLRSTCSTLCTNRSLMYPCAVVDPSGGGMHADTQSQWGTCRPSRYYTLRHGVYI
jgi:hypothetical protein